MSISTSDFAPAESTAFALFMSILGWLVMFRAQLSYSRYLEGLTHVERACGVWLTRGESAPASL